MAELMTHYANFRVPALLREADNPVAATTLTSQAHGQNTLKPSQDEVAPRKAAEPLTTAERVSILKLYAAGYSCGETARRSGRALDTVQRVLKDADVAIRHQTRPYEPDTMASRNQAIVDAHGSGVRTVDLAAKYGLDPSGIRRIIRQHQDPEPT